VDRWGMMLDGKGKICCLFHSLVFAGRELELGYCRRRTRARAWYSDWLMWLDWPTARRVLHAGNGDGGDGGDGTDPYCCPMCKKCDEEQYKYR
jgi:hypothetical protein